MSSKVFLSCYDDGISRAEQGADGEWWVEQLVTELKVTCLAEDPSNPEVAYAGTRQHGVWRSDDCGRTWSPLGMADQIVKSLTVSPHDPLTLYAGSKPATIFKSTDGGQNWRELEGFRRIPGRWWWFSPADPPDRRPYVMAISVSPTEPEVVLAGVEFGAVSRSEDGGQTWSPHLRGSLRDCHSMKFHPSDGSWAYEAGGSGGGASFSNDGGHTWHKAKRGLEKNYGIVCAADPVQPDTWYVCTGASPFNAFGNDPKIYLYRSRGGSNWQPIGWHAHPLKEAPTSLVTVPGQAGHLYAGLKGGDVWHTADYGDTWEQMPFKLNGIWFSMLILG